MKKLLIIFLAVMMLALLAGCGEEEQIPYTEPGETEVALHTMVPTEVAEPEWVSVEYCTLRVLNSRGEELLTEEEIEAFAIAPFGGKDVLAFLLTGEGKSMLEAMADPAGYSLMVNGGYIAGLQPSDDGSVLFATDLDEEQMWQTANKIRGFE